MADIFYKGEDIAITFELFEDENPDERINLNSVDVDMLLYTSKKGPMLNASTKNGKEFKIVTIMDGKALSLVIPAQTTLSLTPGVLTVEMRVTNRETGSVKIAISSAIRIEQSNIGAIK